MTNIYNNGKIYKLINSDNTLCYIGSTTQSLEHRKSQHTSDYKKWKAGKINYYITSFKVIESDEDGLNIFLLENVGCNSKEQLLSRERHYIDINECVNKYIPNRTRQEYYKDNKEIIQKYYKDNKEIIQKYYNDNKTNILENRKDYYKDNKDRILKKCACDCGGQYTYAHKSKHLKTKKHQSFLQSDTS